MTLTIDKVVEAKAKAKLRLVAVFGLIPPTTTHPPPHKLNLAVSQLPVVRSEHVRTFFHSTQSQQSKSEVLHKNFTRQCALRHNKEMLSISALI